MVVQNWSLRFKGFAHTNPVQFRKRERKFSNVNKEWWMCNIMRRQCCSKCGRKSIRTYEPLRFIDVMTRIRINQQTKTKHHHQQFTQQQQHGTNDPAQLYFTYIQLNACSFFPRLIFGFFLCRNSLECCFSFASTTHTHTHISHWKRRPLIAITRFTHSSSNQQQGTGGGGVELANMKSPISRHKTTHNIRTAYICFNVWPKAYMRWIPI